MDQPSAADSCASALGLLLTPTSTVQRHLAAAARDPESLPTLYGALLTGKIYAKDFEVILGVDGPSVDFRPRTTACGPALVVFTSRDRFEHGQLSFDYRLRPGVVRSSNAIALMRAVGLEV